MTRGKHASSAAARRAREEAEAQVVRLEREVTKLTKERDELRKVMDDAKASYEATMGRLQMRIADGTSDAMDRMRADNIRLLCERAKVEGRADGAADALRRAISGMYRFLNSIGIPKDQARVTINTWIGDYEPDEMVEHHATVKLLAQGYRPEQ